jgi:hypothetical protein
MLLQVVNVGSNLSSKHLGIIELELSEGESHLLLDNRVSLENYFSALTCLLGPSEWLEPLFCSLDNSFRPRRFSVNSYIFFKC